MMVLVTLLEAFIGGVQDSRAMRLLYIDIYHLDQWI